jgi:hypothetical protein
VLTASVVAFALAEVAALPVSLTLLVRELVDTEELFKRLKSMTMVENL